MNGILLLVISILFRAAFSDLDGEQLPSSRELPPPCHHSLFADSYIVVQNRHGLVWVDGHQLSLDLLNQQIDKELQRPIKAPENFAILKHVYREDGAKLFYTADYTHVITFGVQTDVPVVQIAVVDVQKAFSSMHSGFLKLDHILSKRSPFQLKHVSRNNMRVYGWIFNDGPANRSQLCDAASVFYIPSEKLFRFDGNKTMTFKIVERRKDRNFWVNYVDQVYPKSCEKAGMPKDVPYEAIADFNKRVLTPDTGLYRGLYRDPKKRPDEYLYFNQLESGKFKLQVEEINNKTYHVLTRLDAYDFYKERERCYVREIEPDLEFPRMLIIPKESGPAGVPIPLLTTTLEPTTTSSTTTTSTSTASTTTTSETSTSTTTTPEEVTVEETPSTTTTASTTKLTAAPPTQTSSTTSKSSETDGFLDLKSTTTDHPNNASETTTIEVNDGSLNETVSGNTTTSPLGEEDNKQGAVGSTTAASKTNKHFYLFIGLLVFAICGAAVSALLLFLIHRNVLFSGKGKKTEKVANIDRTTEELM